MILAMSDHDITGLVGQMFAFLNADESWSQMLRDADVRLLRFADVGLDTDAADEDVRSICVQEDIVLITGNRNQESETSLNATLRRELDATAVPVLTVADVQRFSRDSTYREDASITALQYLTEIDRHRGAGRLRLPDSPA